MQCKVTLSLGQCVFQTCFGGEGSAATDPFSHMKMFYVYNWEEWWRQRDQYVVCSMNAVSILMSLTNKTHQLFSCVFFEYAF